MKRSLALKIVITIIAIMAFGRAPLFATNDGNWLGMDHPYGVDNENYNTAYPYQSFAADLTTVGIHSIRSGLTPNNPFCQTAVSYYLSEGIALHNVIGPQAGETDAAFKARCVSLMTEYKGKVFYYIIGNEPDGLSQTWHDQNGLPYNTDPAGAVQYCADAYQAAQQVDPTGAIKIESPPTTAPDVSYLQGMINAGVANVCDYIGTHVYNNQIDDGRLNDPWIWQQAYVLAHGGTPKPMASSEDGVDITSNPNYSSETQAQREQYAADWLDAAYVQFKRYGYSNVILFESTSITGSGTQYYDLLRSPVARGVAPPIITQTYSELQNYLNPTDPTNSSTNNFGFENPDPSGFEYKHGWVVYTPNTPYSTNPMWIDASLVNYSDTAHVHSGAHSMRFDTSVSNTRIGSTRIVRRVVSVTPGQQITVSAWVYSHSGGQNYLKIEGYSANDGNNDLEDATFTENAWTQLAVTVTPTNPWIVIELASDADGVSGSYVNWDDVAVMNGIPSGGINFVNTNLDSATPGYYGSGQANGTTINSGGDPTTQMTVAADSLNTLQILTPSNGVSTTHQAMQFTKNETSTTQGIVTKSLPGLTVGPTGNNYIQGGYDFSTLSTVVAGPSVCFFINSGGSTGPSSSTNDVDMQVRGLKFAAFAGGSVQIEDSLTQNDVYHVDWYLDLSSTTQDTWGYTLTDLTTGGTVIDTQSGLLTRATTAVTPNILVFNGNTTGSNSATPFAWIDNVECDVPGSGPVHTPSAFFSSTLDIVPLGNYGSGLTNGNIINTDGDPELPLTVTGDNTNPATVATLSGSNRVLEFTKFSSTDNVYAVASAAIPNMSSDTGGNNYVEGGFDFSPLMAVSSGPGFNFLINPSSSLLLGSTSNDVDIQVRGVTFSTATGGTNPPTVTLTQNDVYHIEFYLDASTTTRHTWGYTLTDTTTGGTVIQTESGLLCRPTVNNLPNIAVFTSSQVGNPSSTDSPFIWIDNVGLYETNVSTP